MEIYYWKETRNWRAHVGKEVHDEHLTVDFYLLGENNFFVT